MGGDYMSGCNHFVGIADGYENSISIDFEHAMDDQFPFKISSIDDRFVYCPRCGVHIDWSVIERHQAAKDAEYEASVIAVENKARQAIFNRRMIGSDGFL